jgi:hypothetical protein
VTVYPPYASGEVAPVRSLRITGEDARRRYWTALGDSVETPQGLVVDERGYVYVSVDGPYAILVYAPRAAGEAAPVRTMRWPGYASSEHYALWRTLARDRRGLLYVADRPIQRNLAGC